jgi:phosphoribosylformylglycinamidine cyclo-ligase
MGAKPLFFLDYIGTGELSPEVTEQILIGLTRACRNAGIALIGGETAEMPGFYGRGEYDIAGTIIGVVEESEVVDGSTIVPGDVVIGLRSNGLHTNGYSLARKIVTEVAGKKYTDIFQESGRTFGLEMLRPHRAYSPVLNLMKRSLIKGCVHITGGGFQENIDRVLPESCTAVIRTQSWTPDPVFRFLQEQGGVENFEMYRTFNMGIGMTLIVDKQKAGEILRAEELSAFEPVIIGSIVTGDGTVGMEF